MGRLLDKCQHYARIGIPQIFVFDPERRRIWKWNPEIDDLMRIENVELGNGAAIAGEFLWQEALETAIIQTSGAVGAQGTVPQREVDRMLEEQFESHVVLVHRWPSLLRKGRLGSSRTIADKVRKRI